MNILIIDDEEGPRLLIGELLRRNYPSAKSSYASNAKEAIRYIQHTMFDLIFLDIEMPDMSGLEFLNHIRSSDNKVPVCITTAFPYFEYAQTALKLGAFDYLLKPIRASSLKQSLTKWEKEYMTNKINLSLPFLQGFMKVEATQITYIQVAEKNKIRIYMIDGKYLSPIYLSLFQIEEKLPGYFLRVSRQIIINTLQIQSFNPKNRKIILNNSTCIICSRSKVPKLKNKFRL